MVNHINELKFCPICEREAPAVLVEAHGDYLLWQCMTCDVVFADPMRGPGSEWYEESKHYRQAYNPNVVESLQSHSELFFTLMPSPRGRLLDVGCGAGRFVLAARHYGYSAVGIDFNRHAIEWGRQKHGLDALFAMTLEEYIRRYPDDRFDVITFFEVLEHLDSPADFACIVHSLLKPSGYVALSVPDREGLFSGRWDEGNYPPHHLTRWSSRALRHFWELHGFAVLKLQPIGSPSVMLLRRVFWELRMPSVLDRVNELRVQLAAVVFGTGQKSPETKLDILLKPDVATKRLFRAVLWPSDMMLKVFGHSGYKLFLLGQKR
jgi:SAM-dependent methyltransferase